MSRIISRLEYLALKKAGKRLPGAGRPKLSGDATARKKTKRQARENLSETNVATCDFETDPFDNVAGTPVYPVLFCLRLPSETITVLRRHGATPEEDEPPLDFAQRCHDTIKALPGRYIIYAHNGGKFDFMFFIHFLRGEVLLKGSAIMKASVGKHELRDSMHIIPGKLANYRKDEFDYKLLKRNKRLKKGVMEKIIKYCVNDCIYLHERVSHFVKTNGFKISIGQAAFAAIKKAYPDEMKDMRISAKCDAYIRPFFFGGRTECLEGIQHIKEPLCLYDVNSMYPSVMAYYKHPIDGNFNERIGLPTADTIFIELECDNNGALLTRVPSKDEIFSKDEVTANIGHGVFLTTIWEYKVARKYKLIKNVKIRRCIDFAKRTDFSRFVLPNYEERFRIKTVLEMMENHDCPEYYQLKMSQDDIKNKLNNGYGKFAQDPSRYIETWYTSPNMQPPKDPDNPWGTGAGNEWIGTAYTKTDHFWIWQRPAPQQRYNNVATAASITGAARSKLLEALQHAERPLYCDTDSILCRSLDESKVEIHTAKLGAWKLEARWTEAIILAKKGYFLYNSETGQFKSRWKGLPLHQQDYKTSRELFERCYRGESIPLTKTGVSIAIDGSQQYITRNMRANAKGGKVGTTCKPELLRA